MQDLVSVWACFLATKKKCGNQVVFEWWRECYGLLSIATWVINFNMHLNVAGQTPQYYTQKNQRSRGLRAQVMMVGWLHSWKWTSSSCKGIIWTKPQSLTFHVKFPRFFCVFWSCQKQNRSFWLFWYWGTISSKAGARGGQPSNQPSGPTKISPREVPLRCRGSTTQSGSFFLMKIPGGVFKGKRCGKGKALEFFEADAYEDGMPCWLLRMLSVQSAKGSRLVRVYVHGLGVHSRSI